MGRNDGPAHGFQSPQELLLKTVTRMTKEEKQALCNLLSEPMRAELGKLPVTGDSIPNSTSKPPDEIRYVE